VASSSDEVDPAAGIFDPRLSDVFGLVIRQDEVDFVVPHLREDLPLYLDPFLLWKSDDPEGWTSEPSRTNKGIIFRPPGSEGDANTIRIMEPTSRYPNGYVVIYNSEGQPVDYNLKSHTGPNETILRKTRKGPSRNCPWMDDSCWPHRGGAVSWLMRWLAMIPVMADRRLEGYRSQPSRIPRRRIR
jgi:hypothetical protein